MIPELGLMVGAYIIFRALEAAGQSESRFESATTKKVIQVLAVLLVAYTAFSMYALISHGTPELR